MNRVERFIINRKHDKIILVNSQPSRQTMRDGEEALYMTKNKNLVRYRKERGILWSSKMSMDGNEYIDKDLTVSKDLIVKGNIKELNIPIFEAYASSSQLNLATGSLILLAFNNERFDNRNNYDTSTYLYTATVSGYYLLYYNITFSAFDSGMVFAQISMQDNNNNLFGVCRIDDKEFTADTAYVNKSMTKIRKLDVGDTVGIYYYQNGGTAQVDMISSDVAPLSGSESVFGGYLISK